MLSVPGPGPLPSSERSRHARRYTCRVAGFLHVVGMVGQEKAGAEDSRGQRPERAAKGEKRKVPPLSTEPAPGTAAQKPSIALASPDLGHRVAFQTPRSRSPGLCPAHSWPENWPSRPFFGLLFTPLCGHGANSLAHIISFKLCHPPGAGAAAALMTPWRVGGAGGGGRLAA